MGISNRKETFLSFSCPDEVSLGLQKHKKPCDQHSDVLSFSPFSSSLLW